MIPNISRIDSPLGVRLYSRPFPSTLQGLVFRASGALMRIAIVNQFYPPDVAPTGRLAASLAEHRAHCGDDVTVVTSRGGYVAVVGEEACNEGIAHLRTERAWTPRLGKRNALCRCLDYLAFFVQAVWRLLRMPRQDVVVAMTTPPFLVCAALVHKLLHPRTRLILWNMDCYPEVAERDEMIRAGGWASRLLRAVNRLAFRYIDQVVCLDPAMAALLEENYGSAKRPLPISVIPNWERLDACPRDPRAPPLSEEDARAFRDRFVVLYTGNRGRGHHFTTLFDAAKLLRGEPLCFCFVGGGSQTGAIRQAIVERKLDNMVLLDYVPARRLRALMNSAHCALITLRDEMLGVMSPSKLHANLARGLPIVYVGPPGSNVDLAIEQFGCGVSLRPGDVKGVADFVRSLIHEPGRLTRLRARARRAFEEAYCDSCTLPQFDAVLEGRGQRVQSAAEVERRRAA